MSNLITKLKEKKNSNKGFTLMEMLIVVAIIAILVAVSIPVFTSQLETAKEATDMANERAAKASAATKYLTEYDALAFTATATSVKYYYDAANGVLISDSAKAGTYGKCKKHKNGYIEITINDDGKTTCNWVGIATGGDSKPHNGDETTTPS